MERNRAHGAPWLEDVHALRARKGIDRDGRLLLEGLRLTAAARSAGLAIPMRGVVDSLDVSHAAAIVLWEVFRRAA
jgi:tRNA G18 (ribose-2'-O)-methylase SpoU